MREIWKDIEGYEGFYQISNMGRIKSLERKEQLSFQVRNRKEKILRLANKNGYSRIMLSKNRERKVYFVHILVYKTFIGPIPKGMQVNHIDECKTRNVVSNLNLMSPKENINWGTCIERRSKKNKKPIWQLTLDGQEYAYWFSAKDAADNKETLRKHIVECCCGKRKTANGYKWKYAS